MINKTHFYLTKSVKYSVKNNPDSKLNNYDNKYIH